MAFPSCHDRGLNLLPPDERAGTLTLQLIRPAYSHLVLACTFLIPLGLKPHKEDIYLSVYFTCSLLIALFVLLVQMRACTTESKASVFQAYFLNCKVFIGLTQFELVENQLLAATTVLYGDLFVPAKISVRTCSQGSSLCYYLTFLHV